MSRSLRAFCAAAVVSILPITASAAAAPSFGANQQASVNGGTGWDEPAGVVSAQGVRYASFQNPKSGQPTSGLASAAPGAAWKASSGYAAWQASKPDGDLGDVTMAADRAGTIFLGHLNSNLEADIDYSRDGGKSWQTATNVAQLSYNASSSPALVDRPWITAYSPSTNYLDTRVYLEYHDFAASAIEVVDCSLVTGSLRCGAPTIVSGSQSVCNTIPGGIAVAPPGSAHAGRLLAVWSTADPQTNVLSGCNYTQLAPFYALKAAYSDTPDAGGPWTQSDIYTGPTRDPKCPNTTPVEGVGTATCADMSEIFTPVAFDNAGNAYVAFVDYVDTLDPNYDVYLSGSLDGGRSWQKPVRVNSSTGTHFLPSLVAGDAGRVAVGYYATSYSDQPYMASDSCPTTLPPLTSCGGKAKPEPPSAAWYYYGAVSYDATAASPSFSESRISSAVAHYGDICNLGIYCDGSSTGNRSVFDSTSAFIDLAGWVTFLWSDQRSDPNGEADAASPNAQDAQLAYDQVYAACQTGGKPLLVTAIGPAACKK